MSKTEQQQQSKIQSAYNEYLFFVLDNNPNLPINNEKAEQLFSKYEQLKQHSILTEKLR